MLSSPTSRASRHTHRGLCILKQLGMLVAQRRRPHVCQPDQPLAAAVCKQVAMLRVEVGAGDDLQRSTAQRGRVSVCYSCCPHAPQHAGQRAVCVCSSCSCFRGAAQCASALPAAAALSEQRSRRTHWPSGPTAAAVLPSSSRRQSLNPIHAHTRSNPPRPPRHPPAHHPPHTTAPCPPTRPPTSVRSSMLCGLMSTMLKAWSCLHNKKAAVHTAAAAAAYGNGRSDGSKWGMPKACKDACTSRPAQLWKTALKPPAAPAALADPAAAAAAAGPVDKRTCPGARG